jgi:opacity protein-like surface antigen
MNTACYLLLIPVGLLAPFSAQAQYEREPGELSGYSGVSANGGAHPFVGASAGLDYGQYALGLFDFAYTHLDNDTLRYLHGVNVKGSQLYDVNYSVHFRYTINHRWEPYALTGPSVIWNHYSYGVSTPSGGTVYPTKDDVNFGWHAGGGVRYFVNDSWGVRPEVKVVITGRTYVVFSLGFFFKVPCCI